MSKTMEEVLEGALISLFEADECMAKYMDAKTGRFKGGKGERFESCVQAFSNCKKGIADPEGLCAKIARQKGLAAGGKSESLDEGRLSPSNIDRIVSYMIGAPRVSGMLEKAMPSDEYPDFYTSLADALNAAIVRVLSSHGSKVMGATKAAKALRQMAR